MRENITFATGPAGGVWRLGRVVFAYLGTLALSGLFLIRPEIIEFESFSRRVLLWCLFILYLVSSGFSIRAEVFEFLHASIRVELSPNHLTTFGLFGKQFTLAWEDVILIRPSEKFMLSWEKVHLIIEDKYGKQVVLSHNIEPLGECIKAIEARCPNLESVDYGGLDKTALWTERNKL